MSEYLTLQSRYYALLKMCYFKAYSNVIEGFNVSAASLDKIHSVLRGPWNMSSTQNQQES